MNTIQRSNDQWLGPKQKHLQQFAQKGWLNAQNSTTASYAKTMIPHAKPVQNRALPTQIHKDTTAPEQIYKATPIPEQAYRATPVPEKRRPTPITPALKDWHKEQGAASVAMILTYYGYPITTSKVSKECDLGQDSLSAQSILKAAHHYGIEVQMITINKFDSFKYIRLPAIVQCKFNRFFIIEHWTSTHVYVVDPVSGRQILSLEEFAQNFTGVALLMKQGPRFMPAQRPREGRTSHEELLQHQGPYLQLLQKQVAQR